MKRNRKIFKTKHGMFCRFGMETKCGLTYAWVQISPHDDLNKYGEFFYGSISTTHKSLKFLFDKYVAKN